MGWIMNVRLNMINLLENGELEKLTDEDLKQLIQNEQLKNLKSIKKMLIFFTIMIIIPVIIFIGYVVVKIMGY